MGSVGAIKASGGGNNIPTSVFVKDDYGRDVEVVRSPSEIPSDRQLWPSGAFGKDRDFYLVFARITGFDVDVNSLIGLKVPQEDEAAIVGIAGWRSWKSSAEADKYIKRYDKPGASKRVQRDVLIAKKFSDTMKKYGL